MTKIIRLKESDLMSIIKRLINEQSNSNLETKLRSRGYTDANNTGGRKVLVKKIQGAGNFFFEFKKDGAVLKVLKPSNKIIVQFKLKQSCIKGDCNWYTKGFQSEIESERLSEMIDTLTSPNLPIN
jgi:hypothetical protein